jgi:hypothetical protein
LITEERVEVALNGLYAKEYIGNPANKSA